MISGGFPNERTCYGKVVEIWFEYGMNLFEFELFPVAMQDHQGFDQVV